MSVPVEHATFRVVACSSEAEQHPAVNLQESENYRKWQTESDCRRATVDLEFDKDISIERLFVVNAGSAFIEILVSKTKPKEDNDMTVLLPISTLMTIQEVQKGQNRDRSREYTPDKLAREGRMGSWQFMRVLVTQPFAVRTPIGLASIRVVPRDPKKSTQTAAPPKRTPSYIPLKTLVQDQESSEPIAPGFLFTPSQTQASSSPTTSNNNSNTKDKDSGEGTTPLKAKPTATIGGKPAAEVIPKVRKMPAWMKKEATPANGATKGKASTTKAKAPMSEQARAQPCKQKVVPQEEVERRERMEKLKQEKAVQNEKKEEEARAAAAAAKKKKKEEEEKKRKEQQHQQQQQQQEKEKAKEQEQGEQVPYGEIMRGVTIVISGIVNPMRATLRTLALKMGAKYSPDWNDTCTHLIAAIPDVPKYDQVKALGGNIVTKEWILEQGNRKVRLPYTSYIFQEDANDSSDDDDDGSGGGGGRRQPVRRARQAADTKRRRRGNDSSSEGDDDLESSFIDDRSDVSEESDGYSEEEWSGYSSSSDGPRRGRKKEKKKTKQKKKKKKTGGKDVGRTGTNTTAPAVRPAAKKRKRGLDESSGEGDGDEGSDTSQVSTPARKKRASRTLANDDDDVDDNYAVGGQKTDQDKGKTKAKPADDDDDDDAASSATEDMNTAVGDGNNNDDDDDTQMVDAAPPPVPAGPPPGIPDLPDFFQGLRFGIYGDNIGDKEKKVLRKYICAYDGELLDDIFSGCSHIVTRGPWSAELEAVTHEDPTLKIVSPDYVLDCHKEQKLLSANLYPAETT